MVTKTFSYTGARQDWTVPADVTSIIIEVWGAEGGSTGGYDYGGKGGYAKGTLAVNPGQVLRVYVGGRPGIAGGWPYGGAGGDSTGTTRDSGGGGGSSEVRTSTSIADRKIVAGGGGGSASGVAPAVGGAGGASIGETGGEDTSQGSVDNPKPGTGGTQSGGGSGGKGGTESNATINGSSGGNGGTGTGGGGGKGYYGGGGGGGGYRGGGGGGGSATTSGAGYNNAAGGGGGSNWVGGVTNTTSSRGIREGHGYVRLTYYHNPTTPGAFTSPVAGDDFYKTHTVSWGASTDADNDLSSYEIDYSSDNGATWTRIKSGITTNSTTFDFTTVAASSAAKLRVRARDSGGRVSGWRLSDTFTVTHNVAPLAPTLTAPGNNATFNRAQTQRFDWDFHDDNEGDSQSEYDLRYRVQTTTTWTVVNEITTRTYRDFAANTFAAGDYEWQVRTRDSYGAWGPYSASRYFTAADVPSDITITEPANNETISVEENYVRWSTPEQTQFQVRRVADNGAGAPDTTTIYYDSGQLTGSATRSHPLTFDVNDRSEHIQVRVNINGLWSDWVSVIVHIDYTEPKLATFNLITDEDLAQIRVDITNPKGNLLTYNQSTIEVDTTGWLNNGGSIARSTVQAAEGIASLALTSDASGLTSAYTTPEQTPVIAGQTYTAIVNFFHTVAARDAVIQVTWRDSAGATITTNTAASQVGLATNTWIELAGSVVAPANAATAYIIVRIQGAVDGTETHYIDKAGIFEGDTATWEAGGKPAVLYNDIYRQVAGSGIDDWSHRATNVDANGSWIDNEVAKGTEYIYKVIARGNNGTSSESDLLSTIVDYEDWWIRDPYSHEWDRKIEAEMDTLPISKPKDIAFFNPLGREGSVAVEDVHRSERIKVTIGCVGTEEYRELKRILALHHTLLLQSPMVDEQWYVRIQSPVERNIINMVDPYVKFAVEFVEVEEPDVPR